MPWRMLCIKKLKGIRSKRSERLRVVHVNVSVGRTLRRLLSRDCIWFVTTTTNTFRGSSHSHPHPRFFSTHMIFLNAYGGRTFDVAEQP